MAKHDRSLSKSREFLYVYTDLCNLPHTPRHMQWIEFSVPTDWLMENMGITDLDEISRMLERFDVYKELVLRDAIQDGVVEYVPQD